MSSIDNCIAVQVCEAGRQRIEIGIVILQVDLIVVKICNYVVAGSSAHCIMEDECVFAIASGKNVGSKPAEDDIFSVAP